MNRIDRISAILIQLQSRRVVKASDIADRFGISLRTVYRDVRSLEEAGIPIIGEAGVGLLPGGWLPPAAHYVYPRGSHRLFNRRKVCGENDRCLNRGAA
jgi:biotin operon repressor